MIKAKAVLLCFALLSTTGFASAETVQSFVHKQWKVLCGPQYCSARPITYESLSLTRSNLGGPWLLSLDAHLQALIPNVSVDGAKIDFSKDQEIDFPENLLSGLDLEFVEGSDDQNFTTVVPLDGLKAALLWADEHQDLVGAKYKFIYKEPDWQAVIAKDWQEKRNANLCDHPDSFQVNEEEPIEVLLPGHPEVRIVESLCWQAAYNIGFVIYVVGPFLDGMAPLRDAVKFPEELYPAADYTVSGNLVDTDIGVVQTYHKGVGYGGCFSAGTFKWDGFYFRLTKLIEDQECDSRISPRVIFYDE